MLRRREFSLGLMCLPWAVASARCGSTTGPAPAARSADAASSTNPAPATSPATSAAAATPAATPVAGAALEISGRLVAADGTTPLAGYTIHVYHTDGEGYYDRPDNDPRKARLKAALVTAADGSYVHSTIIPGAYPGRSFAAHIHTHLSGPGVPEHWIDNTLFAHDPLLSDEEKRTSAALGAYPAIIELARASGDAAGPWRGRRELRFDPVRAEKNQLVNGWYRN